jgi:hypothetical protein
VVLAFRRHTLLRLDDCLHALQPTIPHLTRSSLYHCLKRHGISRLPKVEGEASPKVNFKTYLIDFFHPDIAEVQTAQGKRHHYESHNQLIEHLADFVAALNFARRLKTLNGCTPQRVRLQTMDNRASTIQTEPLQQMPGLTPRPGASAAERSGTSEASCVEGERRQGTASSRGLNSGCSSARSTFGVAVPIRSRRAGRSARTSVPPRRCRSYQR